MLIYYKVAIALLALYLVAMGSLSIRNRKRGLEQEVKSLREVQEEQQKLIVELRQALKDSQAAKGSKQEPPTCEDKHEECESWSTCCPNGTGETTCSILDCENDFDPCSGGWMKHDCKRTCGLCPGQKPRFEPSEPVLAPWDRYNTTSGVVTDYPEVEWSKWHATSPRVVYIKNCLLEEHYEQIKKLAAPHLKRSKVVHPTNASEMTDQVRTSQGMWLQGPEFECEAKKRLIDVIGTVSGVDPSHFEAIQILKYNPGEYYIHHSDWFEAHMKSYLGSAGQRIATSITFLNTLPPNQGGNTVFTYSDPQVNVTPIAGDSIIFYNMHRSGRPDKASEHEAVPPKPGFEKWVAVIWIRLHDFV
eukprot:TRINITY_DN463_c0_g2_i1.p1 TRINITY_DN463_c0_g2~~TRINITY_DN463_c0_g2_i1.p1  ORF type:complete len:360 (+),score=57.60 TRINITY_DN463_c0_g2_i1:1480-2559(+)